MVHLFALVLLGSPAAPSVCDAMTTAEAEAFVGEPIAHTMPAGPERDDDSGGMQSTCSFVGKTRALVLSVTEFKSAAEAAKKVTAEYVKHQEVSEDAGPLTVEPEPGLGDRGFYGLTKAGAMVVMLKGARLYGVAIGGNVAAPGSYRAGLHKLVAALGGKA